MERSNRESLFKPVPSSHLTQNPRPHLLWTPELWRLRLRFSLSHRPAFSSWGSLSQVFLLSTQSQESQTRFSAEPRTSLRSSPSHLSATSPVAWTSASVHLTLTLCAYGRSPCAHSPSLTPSPTPSLSGAPLALPSPALLPQIPFSINHIIRLLNTYQGYFPQVKASSPEHVVKRTLNLISNASLCLLFTSMTLSAWART